MAKKSGRAIRHEYIQSLEISANFEFDSIKHIEGLFDQRKKVARDILLDGENEQNKYAYIHICSQIKMFLGILSD